MPVWHAMPSHAGRIMSTTSWRLYSNNGLTEPCTMYRICNVLSRRSKYFQGYAGGDTYVLSVGSDVGYGVYGSDCFW